MGLFGMIDAELQKDLIDFIQRQEEKPYPHVLGDSLLANILKEIKEATMDWDSFIAGAVVGFMVGACVAAIAFAFA